ncbi:MAG: flotillin-like FloA family protein [Phycisphaerales bacterium]|nr:flotillin-like FloA family protein [Planctomycetota bacterium]MCH8508425.1 flotillin-like FloA family protein [Phycisphaerales bacterium]
MPDVLLIAVIALAAIFFLATASVFLEHFGLWLQCRLSGAPIPFSRFVHWKRRRIDGRTLALVHIRLRKEGIEIPTERLEALLGDGGNLLKCAFAMIYARRAGLDLSWDEIVGMDADGMDPLEEVRRVHLGDEAVEAPA